MNARRPKAGRFRASPPGRAALDARAQAEHLQNENRGMAEQHEIHTQILMDRIAELEARVAALTNARDELYAENQQLTARHSGSRSSPFGEWGRCGAANPFMPGEVCTLAKGHGQPHGHGFGATEQWFDAPAAAGTP